MQKVNYNIEYAHIYTNEQFNREHLEASWVLNYTIKNLNKKNKSYSTVVLIDNYNPNEHILDENTFLYQLKQNNASPDFVAYEAQLVPLYEKVLNSIHKKSKRRSIGQYVKTREKIPCSFLIVVWDLLRLGLIQNGIIYYKNGNGKNTKVFIGEKIITILPERFRPVEERAKEIILNSDYTEALKKIEHIYF